MPNSTSPFPPGTAVAAYLRDSGGEDQDLSIQQQEQVIRAWCAENGLILKHIYKDEAKPGSSTIGRDQFQNMINYFLSPDCNLAGIIIWKYNRFSRDIDDAQYYKADLRRRGYTIHSLNDVTPEGINGRIFENIIDWYNAKFLEDMSVDVKRGLKHLIEQHGALGGFPPKGFKRQAINIGNRRDGAPHIVHRWVPDPDQWELCTQVWQMRAAGSSYRNIQNATKLFGTINSYTTFFKNRIYRGELRYGGTTIPNYVPPMVDQDTWDTVQALNKTRTIIQGPHHPRRVSSTYILSGLLQCAQCGAPMNGNTITFKKENTTDHWDYYICSARKRHHNCTAKRIPRTTLEQSVLDNLTQHILTTENITRIREEFLAKFNTQNHKLADKQIDLEKRLAKTRRSITNLTNAIAESGHTRSLLDKINLLEVEETSLNNQIDDINIMLRADTSKHITPQQLQALVDNLKAIISAAQPETIRAILEGFIHHIDAKVIDKTVKGVIYYTLPSTDKKKLNRKQKLGLCAYPPWGHIPIDLITHEFTVSKKKKRS